MANLKFSFAQCLRHVFMSGAGYADDAKISESDQRRWGEYEPPPNVGYFERMNKALESLEASTDPTFTSDAVEIHLPKLSPNGLPLKIAVAIYTREEVTALPYSPRQDTLQYSFAIDMKGK